MKNQGPNSNVEDTWVAEGGGAETGKTVVANESVTLLVK
jgi:hypothetical protein